MIIGKNIYAMLLVETYFSTFTDKPIADAHKTTEVLIALSADSKDEVNRIVDAAMAAGAGKHKEPDDKGFMYVRTFEDPDGHVWEHLWCLADARRRHRRVDRRPGLSRRGRAVPGARRSWSTSPA